MGVSIDQICTISLALGSAYGDDFILFSRRLLLLFSSHFAMRTLGEWVPKSNRNWILGLLLTGPTSLSLTLSSLERELKHLSNLVVVRIKLSSERNQAHSRPSAHAGSIVRTHILWGLLTHWLTCFLQVEVPLLPSQHTDARALLIATSVSQPQW